MKTVRNKTVYLLVALCFFNNLTGLAQVNVPTQYVYRILVYHKGVANPTVLTGFKIKGYRGILTALHGFTANNITNILAFPEKNNGNNIVLKFPKLDISMVDIGNDLAFLKCDDLPKDGGFSIAEKLPKPYEDVYVWGYPQTEQLQGGLYQVQYPSPTMLGEMVRGTAIEKTLEDRTSPGLKSTVIRLPPGAISPGHSGGPVLNKAGQVVGVANGGFIVNKREVGTMAIELKNKLPQEAYSESKTKKILAKINTVPATHLTASENLQSENESVEVINPFNFPDAKPLLTLGGTLSRPFWFTADGIRADLDFRHMNGRFDGYAEIAAGKNWAIGGYVSSRYLQYTILKSFDLSIPLQAERMVRQSNTIDTYGVQVSRIIGRGIVHNTYIGGGYWPVIGNTSEARARFNYRGFVGYRLYAGPQRKIGLEFRAMYVGQNVLEYQWQPTLGNARPVETIQSLNQWYLCGGLTYSIYRHN